ncbi:MAG: peptidoglycan-binding domain-containing protein [Candidatus Paceibacterota bacterium]|jgi:peptidoglycan hydrolase-like protein with peptidoglycan-binding domain
MKKYPFLLLLALLIVSPLAGRGATLDQLQAQLTKLKAQIAILQNRPTADCPFDQNLSLGNGDGDGLSSDVVLVQKFLRASGYLDIAGPTGYFGRLTMGALKHWQRDNNLSASGIFGASERLALCGQIINK